MWDRYSRLAVKLIFGAWVTTNVSQRMVRRLVQLPAQVTFNLSQLGPVPDAVLFWPNPLAMCYHAVRHECDGTRDVDPIGRDRRRHSGPNHWRRPGRRAATGRSL